MSRRRKQPFQARPWFRHYAGARNDPKLKLIAFEDQRHYWCVCEMKCEGELDKGDTAEELRERMIATALGLDLKSAAEVKRRLLEVELINESWQPLGWDKRQFEGDFSTDRMRRLRARRRGDGIAPSHVTSPLRHGDAPDTDQNRTDKESDQNPERAREPAQAKGAARAPSAPPQRTTKAEASTSLRRIGELLPGRSGG